MWKLLQGLHKGRSWEWSALVRPAPQVACLDDDDKKTCVAGAISELHERLPLKCIRKYYPRFSRWSQTSDEKTPDPSAVVTADTVLNSATVINKDTLASRSTHTYTDHPTAEQATDQVTRVIQVNVDSTRSSIPPSSTDVVAEDPKKDPVQPSSRLLIIYTDGTETEDGSKGRCFCGDAGDNEGTKRHWKKWQRDFRHDFWAGLREPFGFVEAMGWSTTLILGLNLCYLWQPDPERKSWSQQLYRVAHSMNHDSTLTGGRRILDSGQKASGKAQPSMPKLSDDKKSSGTLLQSKEVEKDALTEAAEEWQKLTHTYTNMTRNNEARLLAKAGRYRDAFQLWHMAAEGGYDKAHYNMALCYEQGKGTKTDLSKAICHYKMAAVAGHSKAKFNLAILQQQGQGGLQNDPHQVMGLLQEAAESGLKQAQTQLGLLYTAEETRDWMKASCWFQRAAEQNDSMAQYYLGVCYEQGLGVEGDLAKAAEMYSLASQSGHAGADFSLASLYEHGLGGLPQDRELALQFNESSVTGGNQEAETAVHRLRQLLDEEANEAELENEELVSSDFTLSSDRQCQRLCEQLNDDVQDISRQPRSMSSPSLTDYIRQHLIEFGFTSEFDSTESYFTVPTTFVTKSRKTDNAVKSKPSWQGKKTVPCFFIGDSDNRNSGDVEEELCYTRLDGGSFGNIAIASSS